MRILSRMLTVELLLTGLLAVSPSSQAQTNQQMMDWTNRLVDDAEKLSGNPGSRYTELNDLMNRQTSGLTRQAIEEERIISELYEACDDGNDEEACDRLDEVYREIEERGHRIDQGSTFMGTLNHNTQLGTDQRIQDAARQHQQDLLDQLSLQRQYK